MYYKTLGVERTATTDEITTAYKKLRSSAHPDKQGTGAQFIKIQKAYEILSNPARRKCYDETGEDGTIPEENPWSMLSVLLLQMLDNQDETYVDILKSAKNQIKQNKINMESQAVKFIAAATKRENAASRLTRKDGADNLVSTIILNQASDLKAQAAKLRAQESECDDMLAMIDELEYKTDVMTQEVSFNKQQAAMAQAFQRRFTA